jgi:hypothetical protein
LDYHNLLIYYFTPNYSFCYFDVSGVAADLCSVLLALGRPQDAVYYLERGRAVIISQLIDCQSDLPKLSEAHPEVARRYKNLVIEVNAPVDSAQCHEADDAMNRRGQAMDDMTS